MTVHPNQALVQRYLEVAGSGDLTAAKAFFTPDFAFRVPGSSPLAGTTNGPQAPFDYVAAMRSLTGGTHHVEEQIDWLPSDDRVGLLTIQSFERNGERFAWRRLVLFEMEGERFRRVDLFEDDQAGLDAALAR